jgi:hypothetical protein
MRFVVIAEEDGAFTFVARWGETMVARSGDAIVQDLKNPSDTSDRESRLRLYLRGDQQSRGQLTRNHAGRQRFAMLSPVSAHKSRSFAISLRC